MLCAVRQTHVGNLQGEGSILSWSQGLTEESAPGLGHNGVRRHGLGATMSVHQQNTVVCHGQGLCLFRAVRNWHSGGNAIRRGIADHKTQHQDRCGVRFRNRTTNSRTA